MVPSAKQFVILDVARWRFCLAQYEVASIEVFSDAACHKNNDKLEWAISYKNLEIPIYGMDSMAQLCAIHGDKGGEIAIIGNDQTGFIGLRNEASEIIKGDCLTTMSPIPPVMSGVSELVDSFCLYKNHLICVTHAKKLVSYISKTEQE